MAEWKKVIVSGSDISQLNNDANYIVDGQSGVSLTGSFSGSFIGDLTGTASYATQALSASYAPSTPPFPYTGSAIISGSLEVIGLTTLYNSGSTVLEVSGSTGTLLSVNDDVSGDLLTVSSASIDIFRISASGETTLSGSLTVTNGITGSLFGTSSYALLALTASYYDEQDPIFTAVSGTFVTTSSFNNFTSSYNTGSFTGSFKGDGSGLTGITASLLLNSASNGSGISAFIFNGSSNVTVAVSGAAALSSNTVTKWTGNAFANSTITDNGSLVTFSTGALFQGDITVQGTASFQNTQNLLVADRFVLFASGSNTTGDGGIIVQQGTQNIGELYGYDSGVQRWGFTGSFDATSTSYAPEAYIAAVVDVDGGQSDIVKYQKNGNIRVSGSDIYIYA